MPVRPGNSVMMSAIFMSIVAMLVTAVFTTTFSFRSAVRLHIGAQEAVRLAESGLEKARWCLNTPSNTTDCPRSGQNYIGENNVSFGPGTYSVTVSGAGNTRTVTSTAVINTGGSTVTRQLKARLYLTTTEVSFQYGLQAGVGGLIMKNNNKITGNVFSSGSVTGSKSMVTEDVVLAVPPVTTNQAANVSTNPLQTLSLAQSGATLYAAQSFIPTINDKIKSIDLKVARHGNPPGSFLAIYTDNNGSPGTSIYSQALNAPTDNVGWEDDWTNHVFDPATTPQLSVRTRYWIVIRAGAAGDSNNYLLLARDADDSTYATGSSKTSGNGTTWTATGSDLAFQLNLGGIASTLRILCEGSFCANQVGIGGNAYANKIDGTVVDGNHVKIGKHACYQTIVGTVTAGGTTPESCTAASTGEVPCSIGNTEATDTPRCHAGNTDFTAVDFPLTDDDITGMKVQAENGGVFNGNKILGNNESIGPLRINGDLTILAGTNTPAVLNGTLWVKGNIYVQGAIRLSTAYGSDSGTIIADNPDDPAASGRIIVSGNSADVRGNGTAGTYIMLLSASTMLSEDDGAIDISNNLLAGVVYAANGSVVMKNSADLKEVTGQKVVLQNGSEITYESGLATVAFSSGPGASWTFQRGSYQIVD